jgi:hypothetical protein
MRTTLLNPTVWLLAATALVALAGVFRGRDARQSIGTLVHYACMWPVLMLLLAMAGGGVASRAVLGFFAPGAYAEEVIAARSFLEARTLYSSDPRKELEEWSAGSSVAAPPWADLPGITPCQVSALTDRARFYTNHAHTPMLLLAGVPIVKLGGGHGVYATLLLLSVLSIVAIAWVLLERSGLELRSRPALLLLAAIAGWQPVLAGIRQGDAVIPVAALVVLAWHFAARHERRVGTALAAGVAASLALPAVGVLPALLRTRRHPGMLALLVFCVSIAITIAVAGTGVMAAFLETSAATARTYSYALTNYAVLGRAAAAGWTPAWMIATTALLAVVSWIQGRQAEDAFAAFVMVGLLVSPVVWSQQLALIIVPAAALFYRLESSPSSFPVFAWATLMMLLSLPDGSAAWFSEVLPIRFPGGVLPIVSVALVMLWGWVVTVAGAPEISPAPDLVAARQ